MFETDATGPSDRDAHRVPGTGQSYGRAALNGAGPVPAASPSPDADLVPFARLVAREARLRTETLPQIDEARWMILLDIYVAMADARDTPFMSAAHASSVPVSTAQRYIHDMIETGLIAQHKSGADQRVVHVNLTEQGLALIGGALGGLMGLRERK